MGNMDFKIKISNRKFFLMLIISAIVAFFINNKCFSKEKDTFSIKMLVDELKKYNVKYIDIAVAQFIYETGYLKGSCSDILCLGNNLFAMKKSYIRPNVADGEFTPSGGGKYAYYSNWRKSVLDYALYQSHYINKNTTRKFAINNIISIISSPLWKLSKTFSMWI